MRQFLFLEKFTAMKERKTLKGFLTGVLVCVVAFLIFTNIPLKGDVTEPDSILAFKKIKQVKSLIDEHYMGDVDEQSLSDYLFVGMIAGLNDPYSAYYTKKEYEKLSEYQKGYYTGVGITIANRTEDMALMIMDVVKDGPAEKAGIRQYDIIKSIDGNDTEGLTSTEAAALVQYSDSEDVTLGIYRESTEEELEFTIKKESMEREIVSSEILDGNIGRINITSFTGVTEEHFKEALDEMKEKNVSGLIIDLRDNGGGLVSSVTDVLREILPEGVIFSTVDKNGNTSETTCDGKNEIDIPLAVLVNESTASASEIFAGAVQDYEKGTIVGTKTYGKGIVQDIYRLNDGSVIRLTVSHYYTPNGNDIHKKGIAPDVEIEDNADTAVEEQLEAAIKAVS